MPRTLRPGSGQGLKAAQVTNIPAQWDANWFRSFITTHMNPYALQGIQGQQAATPPTMTVAVNSPLQGTQVLTLTAGTTQSTWAPTQTVHLPDAVAFDVEANGGVVDLLLGTSGAWGNGYVMRFDARNGQVAGQILKMTSGTMASIGAAVAAANSAALGGTYRVVAVIGLSGSMRLYVDGALQWSATDATYTLNGSTYMATEVISNTAVWTPSAIDGTLDMTADGVQFVHLASDHASNNVAYNFQGVYSAGNAYVKGDEVVYGQTYWLAINPSTGSTPSTSNANWQAVASYNAYQGAWSAATNYVVGDEVTYAGNYWVCVAVNTNSVPTTSNANWQIAGPANLDNIADGTATQRMVIGNSLAPDTPYNGSFEQFADGQVIADGWTANFDGGSGQYARSTTVYDGTYSQAIGGNNANTAAASRPFGVEPGRRFKLSAQVNSNVANPASLYLRVWWFSSDANLSRSGTTEYSDIVSAGGPSVANTWTQFSGIVQAPADARFARVALYVWGGSATLLFDKVSLTPYVSQLSLILGNTASWIHLGTLVLPGASTATFQWHTGAGYNTNAVQQSLLTIAIRAGNDTVAPNLSGISAMVAGNTNPLNGSANQVLAVATGNSTAVNNHSWELYIAAAPFTSGPLTWTVDAAAGASFTPDGAPVAGPTAPAGAYVYGEQSWLIYPYGGDGLDGTRDGGTFLRMPSPPSVSATANTQLTQSGTGTTINVAAGTFYLGNVTLNYNSGSVNPGAYGQYYVYFDTSGYAGGAVTFHASTNPLVTSQAPGRFYVGTITTVSGGGGGGGSGGGKGCCLHESQMIELADGREIPARELTTDMALLSHEGPTPITQLRFLPHREWYKVRLDNGVELFVAGDHRFLDDDFNQLRTWDLKLQQRVRSRNGYAIVTGLDILWTEATKVAIEVGEPHTYYVQGILSHNKMLC